MVEAPPAGEGWLHEIKHDGYKTLLVVEGGKVRPSTDALERFAQATRTRLRIVFEPQPTR